MKQWVEEKRLAYIDRVLRMKASTPVGVGGIPTCECGLGRAVWRCNDCADKRGICLFCCRNRHKLQMFHRVEKWNGRFYQKGALWQVGVKIFVGHNGHACPKSVSALSETDLNRSTSGHAPPLLNVDIQDVARQFSKSTEEVLSMIANMLDSPFGGLSEKEKMLLEELCRRTGETSFRFLQRLKELVLRNMEREAEALQADADHASAEAEIILEEDPAKIPIVTDTTGDDDWEDEDNNPKREHLPRFLPRPPPTDGAGNTFVTVVHTNGFHSLPVVWCNCVEGGDSRDLQLLDLHLYPASYDNIKTVFTFSCLDDHRYDYLECKSSHYQYHNKLRRLTCPEYPDAAPNRYAELCRVARQWRNIKYRKWFWQFKPKVDHGDMALFCAACPQPNINLPENWKEDYSRNPYVYIYSISHSNTH